MNREQAQVVNPRSVDSPANGQSRRLEIFRRLLKMEAGQPATNYFRAIELDTVLRNFSPSGRLLDIGCGNGSVASLLFEAWPELRETFGIDLDAAQVALAIDRRIYTTAVTGSAHEIPVPDASFDAVFSNSVIEHIPFPERTIQEMSRVLRPGGTLAFTLPTPDFNRLMHGACFPASLYLPSDRAEYERHMDERMGVAQYLTPEGWRELAVQHSFTNVRFVRYLQPHQIHAWERISNLTGGLAFVATRKQRLESVQRSMRVASPGGVFSRVTNLVFSPFLTGHLEDSASQEFGCLLFLADKNGATLQ